MSLTRREWCRRAFVLGALPALGGCSIDRVLGVSPKTKVSRATLAAGPWTGVFDTPDPFDAPASVLRDALNVDIPDPENESGAYARPGFAQGNIGNALTAAVGPLYGQAIHTHTALDGSTLNFVIIAGKLLRLGPAIGAVMTITDVTPVGITINSGVGPIPMASLLDNLIVNDGINRPWVGTNLTATPITGTYINYDGAGVAWTAYGAPAVYGGAVFFILNSVGGVSRRQDISWSEPGTPLIGWQQASFDNNWTLSQHATGPLFGLAGDNLSLTYFRASSIGAIYGVVGPNLASTATNDAIALNVGCVAWRTIQQYGTSKFFADPRGRVYLLRQGQAPEPIWHQMRGVVQQHGANEAEQLPTYASSVLEPTLNRYLVTLWRPNVGAADTSNPAAIYSFAADSGKYMGRWTIADTGSGGVGISVMGLLNGQDLNSPTLCVLGEKIVGSGALGFLWLLRIRGWPTPDAGQWLDDVVLPRISIMTNPLGEAEDVVYSVDRVGTITGNASPVRITIQTPTTSGTVIGTPAVNGTSNDGTYRLVAGVSGVQGRGPSVAIAPQSGDVSLGQWNLQRIDVIAVPSTAGPGDL